MNLKRTAAIVVVGLALVAWFSAAMTPVRHGPTSLSPTNTRALDASSAELAGEIARLHERLRPDAPLRQPSRNPFAFAVAAPRTMMSIDERPAISEAAARPTRSQPVLKLSGIAEDAGPSG